MAKDPFQSEESIDFTGENIGDFLLNILTKGLYNQPDLIIREYIQNSHDAICDWPEREGQGQVDIQVAWPNVHIFDNGPGMSRGELLVAMSNLGKSFKEISASSGFMGIGKLAGLSMAARVEIHSSKYGDSERNWVAFNSDEMLTGIMERRIRGEHRSILETLAKHTRYNRTPLPEDANRHYTSVHLLDVNEEYRTKIEDVENLSRTIGLVAPVVQDPEFEHALEIEEMLSVMVPDHYQPIDILINGEPIYRPFVEGLGNPREIQVLDDDGDLLAYGWACLRTGSERYRRQIPEDDLRGIALMKRGIAIGSRSLPEEMGLYSSVRNVIYFRWYCGELYIVDPKIIVSADRTRIRQSPRTQKFIDEGSQEFKKLANIAEKFANRDNAEIVIEETARTVIELEEQVKSQGVSRDRVPRVLSELGKAQSEIEKRKRHVQKTTVKKMADEAEKTVEEILDLLISAQQTRDSSGQDDTLSLSDALKDESTVASEGKRIEETIVVLDITERLELSPRESRIYQTIMQAIATACGGRASKEFTEIALAIETALIRMFGGNDSEVT